LSNALEVTVAWVWLNIPLAVLFFLAWTLIPLWIVFKHPDTGPGIPARDEHPPGRAAAAMASSALRSGPAIPACLPDNPREEALAGHH
jgi:hypothetical protein